MRPSLRLLLAEYQRYSLDRGWFYYPDALPLDVVAEKARNGRIERTLAIPVEDLHEGWETSGQVGQEVYGAGLALVYATRHYLPLGDTGCLAFCDYPMYDFRADAKRRRATWRAGGDPRCAAELRVIPHDPAMEPLTVAVTTRAGEVVVPLRGKQTAEGHAAFAIRGGQTVEIAWGSRRDAKASGVEIGGIARVRAARS